MSEAIDFHSPLPYRRADMSAYCRQKGVTLIEHPSVDCSALGSSDSAVPRGIDPFAWAHFWWPRLHAAALGDLGALCATRFPGEILPGPGGHGATCVTERLAYGRYQSFRSDQRLLPSVPAFARRKVGAIADWPWGEIREPQLEEVVFNLDPSNATDKPFDVDGITCDPEGIRVISRLWCPGKEHLWSRQEETIERFLSLLPEPVRPAVLAFEVEECLAHAYEAREWNGHGHGMCNGVWLEVGLAAIEKIRPTELAVTARIAAELITLTESGFAPIVVNEWGCDTDGTHRLMAAWIFNLCRDLDPSVLANLDVGCRLVHVKERLRLWLDARIAPFVRPRPLIVREALRFLAEAIRDPDLLATLIEVVRRAKHAPPVARLPVTFLREASWGTVVKGPYDSGEAIIRVDPRIYAELADHPHLVLPPRGPYHMTDELEMLWFDVLRINAT